MRFEVLRKGQDLASREKEEHFKCEKKTLARGRNKCGFSGEQLGE